MTAPPTLASMTIEVLYFDGCPNHERLLTHLPQLLESIEDGRRISIPVQEAGKDSTLEIDDQLVQYVVEVNF